MKPVDIIAGTLATKDSHGVIFDYKGFAEAIILDLKDQGYRICADAALKQVADDIRENKETLSRIREEIGRRAGAEEAFSTLSVLPTQWEHDPTDYDDD